MCIFSSHQDILSIWTPLQNSEDFFLKIQFFFFLGQKTIIKSSIWGQASLIICYNVSFWYGSSFSWLVPCDNPLAIIVPGILWVCNKYFLNKWINRLMKERFQFDRYSYTLTLLLNWHKLFSGWGILTQPPKLKCTFWISDFISGNLSCEDAHTMN